MAEVKAGLRQDFRHYVPKIRAAAKDKVIRSVREPGVKEEIQRELYFTIVDKIPKDTGALAKSPLTDGASVNMGVSNWKKYQTYYRRPRYKYAHGKFEEDAMVFDPYDVSGKHYASEVKGFNPSLWLNQSKKRAYNAIANVIVKGVNDGKR